jgi:MraZ protein
VGNLLIPDMHMLIGEHTHTLDDKKRLSLPAKFRTALGKKVIITRGLDRCLFVYSLKEWKEVTKKLSELSLGSADGRAFSRFVLGGAVEVDLDASGRILIPEYLVSFAGLVQRIVVAGVNNRVELWHEDLWRTYTERVETQADTLAEKLTDIGMM